MIGKSQFEGLTQLIEYYKKRPLYITKNNQEIKLTKPVEMIPLDEVISGVFPPRISWFRAITRDCPK